MGAIKNKAIEIAIKQGLEKVKEDPDKNLPKLVEIVKKFDKDNMWESKYQFLEKVTKDKDNNTGRRKKNTVKKRTDQKDKQSRTEYDIPVLRFVTLPNT